MGGKKNLIPITQDAGYKGHAINRLKSEKSQKHIKSRITLARPMGKKP